MATAIGPRLGNHRAPVSLRDAEILAVVGYRSALRELRLATANERRVVGENRSAASLNMARDRTAACVDSFTKALASLNATLVEE
jgi:hypothetical protein